MNAPSHSTPLLSHLPDREVLVLDLRGLRLVFCKLLGYLAVLSLQVSGTAGCMGEGVEFKEWLGWWRGLEHRRAVSCGLSHSRGKTAPCMPPDPNRLL